jgi:hypothetical protein
MKIFIELDFEEMPSQVDVEHYLNELMSNNCLDWYVEGNNSVAEQNLAADEYIKRKLEKREDNNV